MPLSQSSITYLPFPRTAKRAINWTMIMPTDLWTDARRKSCEMLLAKCHSSDPPASLLRDFLKHACKIANKAPAASDLTHNLEDFGEHLQLVKARQKNGTKAGVDCVSCTRNGYQPQLCLVAACWLYSICPLLNSPKKQGRV